MNANSSVLSGTARFNKDFVLRRVADNMVLCTCCGASADTADAIVHEEDCSWHNTVSGIYDFIPRDFLLGGENCDYSYVVGQYADKLGYAAFDRLDKITRDLLDDADEVARSFAIMELGAMVDLTNAPFALRTLREHPLTEERQRKAVRNYILSRLVHEAELEETAAALNRAIAKNTAFNALFNESLRDLLPPENK